MSENDHARFRRLLAEDRLDPAVTRHPSECARCATFSRTFEDALASAAATVPAMPRGLPERVMMSVHGVERQSRTYTRPPPRDRQRSLLGPRRPWWLASAAVAAVIGLVTIILVPILGSDTAAAKALAGAVERTRGAMTAEFAFESTLQLPSDAETAFTIETSAAGELAFDRMLHVRGSSTSSGAVPDAAVVEETFDLYLGEGVLEAAPGGVRERTAPLPSGLPFGDPSALLEAIVTGLAGDVEELAEVSDGEVHLRRFKLEIPASALRAPPGGSGATWSADVWIDRTGLVRRFDASIEGSSGERGSWRSSFRSRLDRLGEVVIPAPAGAVTAGNRIVWPQTPGALATETGSIARAARVPVQSVVADEAFWIGSDSADRLFVQIDARGESGVRVRVGALVSFLGRVRGLDGPPSDLGLAASEGAALLTRLGALIVVEERDLRIDRSDG
jgi:hypothetical protein